MEILVGNRSRKLVPPFRLHRPESEEEAWDLWRQLGPACAFMAGGVDLVNRMKAGLKVGHVVHLGAVKGFGEIVKAAGRLRLGAGATHGTIEFSGPVRGELPEFASAWAAVGNIRIRLKGTLGGNLMAREATYDAAPALMALEAELVFRDGSNGLRRIPVSALSTPDGQPAPCDGLLLAVEVEIAPYVRFAYDRSLKPVVSVAVGLRSDPGQKFVRGAAAVGCAYASPIVAPLHLPSPLSGAELVHHAGDIADVWTRTLPEPQSDRVASGSYRRRMAEILLRRALHQLARGRA